MTHDEEDQGNNSPGGEVNGKCGIEFGSGGISVDDLELGNVEC
jgi:hypothetical protein